MYAQRLAAGLKTGRDLNCVTDTLYLSGRHSEREKKSEMLADWRDCIHWLVSVVRTIYSVCVMNNHTSYRIQRCRIVVPRHRGEDLRLKEVHKYRSDATRKGS